MLAPRQGLATLEIIAVNVALAGAAPEHLPVIVAAVRAVAEPRFNLKAIQTTTHPCAPLVIVNGPVARRLGIAGGANALGQGQRRHRSGPALDAPERGRGDAGAGGSGDPGALALQPNQSPGGACTFPGASGSVAPV
jgi:hypothetical protein